ncbi:hypothetical protein OG203_26515 [Nocardia sp. NBC_01499]|uniref:hypothetical protein n=1 Tax=Nocardia sp. NBC_01499 TaxID=2903597 RepID=UPI003865D053
MPALAVLTLAAGPVPAQADPALPAGCEHKGNTITCGSLKDGDVVMGTDGDDTIVIKGDVPKGAAVRGGAGNDNISVYDVGVFVCTGDVGATSEKGGEVDGGAGDDTILIGGGARDQACQNKIGNDIPLGNVSEQGKVIGGPGNDKITVGTLGYVKNDPEHADKSLEVIAGRVDGGDGDDIIDVGSVATGASFDNLETADGVYGGAGNDTIHVGNVDGFGLVSGGPGPDTLTIDGMNGGYVEGNDGDDTFVATKGPIKSLAKFRGGPGNDTMTARSLWGATALEGEEGDDVIKVTNINGPDDMSAAPGFAVASADGGPGNDTITVELIGNMGSASGDEGNDTIDVKSLNGPEDVVHGAPDELKWHAGRAIGGDGDDKITVGTVGKMGEVWGDGYPGAPVKGRDVIKVGDVNGQAKVRGGPLADVITVTNINSKQASVNGEGGNDKITVTGVNKGTVIGGVGKKDICNAKGTKKTCEIPAKKAKQKK